MEWLCQILGAVWQYISSSAVCLWRYISANTPAVLSAFFGTFVGAFLAFFFERRDRQKLARDADLMAGTQARFALMSQEKTMTNIRREYLDPLRKDENRHRKLQRYPLLAEYPTVPFNGLGYFLKDREGERILSETRAAEEGFFRFLRLLDQRNPRYDKMQRGIVQQAAQRAVQEAVQGAVQLALQEAKTVQQAQAAQRAAQQAAQQAARGVVDVNNALTETLVKADTDSLYESVDDALKHHEASIKRIDGYLKKRFRKNYRTLDS